MTHECLLSLTYSAVSRASLAVWGRLWSVHSFLHLPWLLRLLSLILLLVISSNPSRFTCSKYCSLRLCVFHTNVLFGFDSHLICMITCCVVCSRDVVSVLNVSVSRRSRDVFLERLVWSRSWRFNVSVSRVWKIERLGLDGSTSRSRLGLEGWPSRSCDLTSCGHPWCVVVCCVLSSKTYVMCSFVCFDRDASIVSRDGHRRHFVVP